MTHQEQMSQLKEDLASAQGVKDLEQVRIKYLGKKGLVAQMYAQLATAENSQKARLGKEANDFKVAATQMIDEAANHLQARDEGAETVYDVSLPGVMMRLGHQHPISQTMNEIVDIFKGLGFVMVETPELENEFHNFTGLNIPIDHPSRDAFDTFYVEKEDPSAKGRKLLLRSHTSGGQVRLMKQFKPPMAIIIPGRVYRPDAVDASHSFMFHQLEGLLVSDKINFGDLKGLLTEFCRRFFGVDVVMRFRPHYFPFTEPSAEVDIGAEILGIGKKKWLEIMGCGLINPKVFDAVGYPKGRYQGLAFGMGIERMAMLKHRISDIRYFYENDHRFLKQF